MLLTPNLYSKGTWKGLDPFNIPVDKIYVSTAIRSFKELESKGIDVYEDYYVPLNISEETFLEDRNKYASIVTLASDNAPTIYIPDTYIASFPDSSAVPYNHVVLSTSLGGLPDGLVLDDLQEKVSQLVMAELGIEVSTKVHVSSSKPLYVSATDHKLLNDTRMGMISNNKSLYTQLKQKDDQIESLLEQIGLLEELVSQS